MTIPQSKKPAREWWIYTDGIEFNQKNRVSLAVLNDVPIVVAGESPMVLVREVAEEPTAELRDEMEKVRDIAKEYADIYSQDDASILYAALWKAIDIWDAAMKARGGDGA